MYQYKVRYGVKVPRIENSATVKFVEPKRKGWIMKALICLLGCFLSLVLGSYVIASMVPEWGVPLGFLWGVAMGITWYTIYQEWIWRD